MRDNEIETATSIKEYINIVKDFVKDMTNKGYRFDNKKNKWVKLKSNY